MTIRQRASAVLKSDRNVIVAGWVLYAAFSGLLLLLNSSFWLYVAGLTVIYAISALGLDWIQGRAGQVSIGSAGFMAVGAFVAAVAVGDGVPSLLALVLAGIAGGLVGVLVGLPALRLRGLYLALATLALQFISSALGNEYEITSGNIAGVPVLNTNVGPISLSAGPSFFIALIILLAIVILALQQLYRRAPGRAWLAIKESEMAAAVIGLNPTRWKLSAFAVSSALISMSGGLLGFYTLRVDSESFSLDFAISFVAIVIVGGLGSIGGVILGAIVITVTPYLLSTWTASLPSGTPIAQWLSNNVDYINSGLYGIILLAFLLFQPQGIGGVARNLRVWLIRRLDRLPADETDAIAARRAAAAAASPDDGEAAAPAVAGAAGAVAALIAAEHTDSGLDAVDQQPGAAGDTAPLLAVRAIRVYRSGACAVDGVDLAVQPGEVVAILGRNGAGKTSTLRGISGFFLTERAKVTGSVTFLGRDIRGMSPVATAKLGLVLVPEREKVFPNLTVAEHFRVVGAERADIEQAYGLFPQLASRAKSEAGLLSGGERQMLALGVAFSMKPKLLLVDELSLGLAPGAVLRLTAALRQFQQDTGVGLILVEQNVAAAMELADRIYILEAGRVERTGRPSELSEETLLATTLGG
jgi:ABC-type branched-subunit amino acid transport system ATPase component/ABC-type branched-subunit amino acid transport system permease subunit